MVSVSVLWCCMIRVTSVVGEEHLKFKTMLPIKEALGERDENLEHTGPIVFQGLLLKQGRRVNIWRERYFVLKETGLQYFR